MPSDFERSFLLMAARQRYSALGVSVTYTDPGASGEVIAGLSAIIAPVETDDDIDERKRTAVRRATICILAGGCTPRLYGTIDDDTDVWTITQSPTLADGEYSCTAEIRTLATVGEQRIR